MTSWKELGRGSFNYAFHNEDRTRVLKVPQINNNALGAIDTPERAMRLWQLINPDLTPVNFVDLDKAEIQFDDRSNAKNLLGKGLLGWECPYVPGDQATDEQISATLIDIFNRTNGRVIIDATSPRNFITTQEGRTHCIDIGLALKLQIQEEASLNQQGREKSIISSNTWEDFQYGYACNFQNTSKDYPQTVKTIKALLFITENRPDMDNVSFLQGNDELCTLLAKAYDAQLWESPFFEGALLEIESNARKSGIKADELLVKETRRELKDNYKHNPSIYLTSMSQLEQVRPVNFVNTKESCINQLQYYINSRGKINQQGIFEPSLITRLFRNQALTQKKVEAAKNLIAEIKDAQSSEEIKAAIKTASAQHEGQPNLFAESLGARVAKMKIILQKYEEKNNNHTATPQSKSF